MNMKKVVAHCQCENLPANTNVGKTQISNIIKNKAMIREEYEIGLPQSKKQSRTFQYADLNKAVWEWFKKMNEQ